MKKVYSFKVNFYETYGEITVEADSFEEAYDKAENQISDELKELSVEVEYDLDCIEEPEDDDYDEE